jgi:hypothetical protein
MVDSMFPDVFQVSRTDLQFSSFYETSRSSRKQTNPEQHTPPKQPIFKEQSIPRATGTLDKPVETCAGVANASNEKIRCVLPPMRRVVKLSVSPRVISWGVACVAVVNVLACLQGVRGGATEPVAYVFWGTFCYLWLLVSLVQTITHAVYVCTPLGLFCSMAHLGVVTVAGLVPRGLFVSPHWAWWLAPSLCVVCVSHQCHMMWLVYAHALHRKLYIGFMVLGTVLPLTQVLHATPVSTEDAGGTGGVSLSDTTTHNLTWSSISIAVLYGAAFFNCREAAAVDIAIVTSPFVWAETTD